MPKGFRCIRAVVGLLAVLAGTEWSAAGAAPPADGDELITLLVKENQASLAAVRSVSYRLRKRMQEPGIPGGQAEMRAVVIRRGTEVYADMDRPAIGAEGLKTTSSVCVLNSKYFAYHVKGERVAHKILFGAGGSVNADKARRIEQYLPPNVMLEAAGNSVEPLTSMMAQLGEGYRWSARRAEVPAGGRETYTLELQAKPKDGGWFTQMRYVLDPKKGYLIERQESLSPAGEVLLTKTVDLARVGQDGPWFPMKVDVDRRAAGRSTLEVGEVKLDPTLPATQFVLAGLKLAPEVDILETSGVGGGPGRILRKVGDEYVPLDEAVRGGPKRSDGNALP